MSIPPNHPSTYPHRQGTRSPLKAKRAGRKPKKTSAAGIVRNRRHNGPPADSSDFARSDRGVRHRPSGSSPIRVRPETCGQVGLSARGQVAVPAWALDSLAPHPGDPRAQRYLAPVDTLSYPMERTGMTVAGSARRCPMGARSPYRQLPLPDPSLRSPHCSAAPPPVVDAAPPRHPVHGECCPPWF